MAASSSTATAQPLPESDLATQLRSDAEQLLAHAPHMTTPRGQPRCLPTTVNDKRLNTHANQNRLALRLG